MYISMERKKKGFFLVLEGIDGSGKTTHAQLLADELKREGYRVHITKEPTDGKIGFILNEYLRDPKSIPVVDALLFAADRVEHCYTEIIPKLKEGWLVISARYRDSSYAYQSTHPPATSSEHPSENLIPDVEWLRVINRYSIPPDLTIVLDLPPDIAYYRRLDMNRAYDTELDKFEKVGFLNAIRDTYVSLTKSNHITFEEMGSSVKEGREDPHVLITLDGSESIDEVHSMLMRVIRESKILEYVEKN